MNRRAFAITASLVSLILAAICLSGGAPSVRRAPNIILIVADDAGYADFGCYGSRQIPTPNIDALASGGVRFTNGYVTASVCCPSRAGLITGRYQQRFGHEFNGPINPQPGFTKADLGLDPAERTIADELKGGGYRTIAIGKWHLGEQPQHHPERRGFDEFYGFLGGSRGYFSLGERVARGRALRKGDAPVPEDKLRYLTDELTEAAVSFIDRNKSRPFFVYLAYNAVHTPMHARKDVEKRFEHIEKAKRRTYAAMMASLDEGVGRIRESLRGHGLERDTLVIFVNDNGGATTNASDNGPLRGMKGSKWEGGVRVPFVMNWPAALPAGKVYDQPVSTLDILPTCLAAARGRAATGSRLDGVNLLPYLSGENSSSPHKMLFWKRGPAAAVRAGKWKLIRVDKNPVRLFDLTDDLGETRDLAAQNPKIVDRLAAALAKWQQELAPPKWKSADKWQANQILKHRMDVVGRETERKLP